MAHDDITCKRFVQTLADYLAGQLGEDASRQSELHLEVCPDCVHYLRDYEVTIRLARSAGARAEGAGEPMPPELAKVILSARRKPS